MEGNRASPDPLNPREQEILARLAIGFSDQQIADALFLSLNTVKWYNRQIYSKLGVNSRTQAIAQAKTPSLSSESRPKAQPLAQRHLPVPTSPFIGRSREIAALKQLLSTHRLVTLTGTGGIGKTRLALQVALESADRCRDGVYFVDLAPVGDPTQVAKAIAGSLGILEGSSETILDTLKRVLAQQEMLLLVDNFEHVIAAAPLLSELLGAAGGLRVLVTSRETLHLNGEQEYPVPPLSLPSADVESVDEVIASEAVTLFVQRAQMTLPRFAIVSDNAPIVAEICARLDGLPLAIELAAARSKLLTPQALLERLDSRLTALAGGARDLPMRQRTLRDSIEWSYNLLDADEKRLFARLAVFRGGCSLEAIEVVCNDALTMNVFDALASLVDKSLVQQKETPEGEPRFILLETLREYAHERLEASGETEAMRQRHAAYFVELAERAEPELRLARYDYWCQHFEIEVENLRSVLDWSLNEGDVTLGVRLAGALCLFWYGSGYHVEGHQWTRQLIERLDNVPIAYHPRFLISAGHMTFLYDLSSAQPLFARALTIARDLHDQLQTAWSLALLGYTMQREPKTALATAEEGLSLFYELNYLPGIAQTLNIIGEISRFNGDDVRATQVYEACLSICQQTGETRRTCYMFTNLAYIAQHQGDHDRAIELAHQSLVLSLGRQSKFDIAEALSIFAGSISAIGDPQRAAQLLGAVEALYERMGAFFHPSDQPEKYRIMRAVRAQLDETTFQAAWAAGRGMTLEEVVADVPGEA